MAGKSTNSQVIKTFAFTYCGTMDKTLIKWTMDKTLIKYRKTTSSIFTDNIAGSMLSGELLTTISKKKYFKPAVISTA